MAEAVAQRGLDGVKDLGRVLAARLRTNLQGQLQSQMASVIDLVPPALRDNPRFAELASAADERFAQLGSRAVEQRPRWLTEHLGPVPDDMWERLDYERRAGLVAGWRELAGHTDERSPIGAPPQHDSAQHRAVWQVAHAALGQPDAGPAEADMSDAQLRVAVDRWRREDAAAPAYVADELEAAHHTERTNRVNATHWEAAAGRAQELTQRQVLMADARRAREAADAAAARIPELERKAALRTGWYVDKAEIRDGAARALSEAAARGINLDEDSRAEESVDIPNPREAVETAHQVVTTAANQHAAYAAVDQHQATQQDLPMQQVVQDSDAAVMD